MILLGQIMGQINIATKYMNIVALPMLSISGHYLHGAQVDYCRN